MKLAMNLLPQKSESSEPQSKMKVLEANGNIKPTLATTRTKLKTRSNLPNLLHWSIIHTEKLNSFRSRCSEYTCARCSNRLEGRVVRLLPARRSVADREEGSNLRPRKASGLSSLN